MTVAIRPATEHDQAQILNLARGERVKPFGLHWQNFVVAEKDHRIIGAVQLRTHRDGSHELGSLVVEPASRGQGIAARLIDKLLDGKAGRILIITGRAYADHYRRWGFERIAPGSAPPVIRLNYWLGHLGGRIMSLVQRRTFNPLAVLDRASPARAQVAE
jgi:N-acetylglutamate synthase-like GNAT family acetyltransferase